MKELVSITLYAYADRVGDSAYCKNVRSRETFVIKGEDLMKQLHSADKFSEVQPASKTRMAELLISAGDKPFTVVFQKQDGSDRTLRGRLVSPEPLLGRSLVEDMDVPGEYKLRLVDHRTIQTLIIGGVKYEK